MRLPSDIVQRILAQHPHIKWCVRWQRLRTLFSRNTYWVIANLSWPVYYAAVAQVEVHLRRVDLVKYLSPQQVPLSYRVEHRGGLLFYIVDPPVRRYYSVDCL